MVKTVDLVTGRKVFVNMVGHPKVAAPGNWGGGLMPEEVQKALDNIDDLSNAQVRVHGIRTCTALPLSSSTKAFGPSVLPS